MFSTKSDNCTPFVNIFDIIFLFPAELDGCLGFYAISIVFQLFNSDSSQIHASWSVVVLFP